MSTRFNSVKNKPGLQALTTKRKVLKEFQRLQDKLSGINQETIVPVGQAVPQTDEFDKSQTVSVLRLILITFSSEHWESVKSKSKVIQNGRCSFH